MVLRVSYPETYPDIAPDLELTTAPNARKYDHFDVQAEKAQLLDGLQPTIEENLGMPMIFTLVTTLKENAEALITERLEMAQKEKEAEALKAEEEENRKFQGEAVTKESFLTWMDGFKKEVAAEEKRLQEEKELEEKKKRVAQKEKKLTGRELWERGIAKGGDEDEEDDDGDEGDEDPPPPYEDVAKMSVRD
ncbi:hypothetical protein FH972_025453 [Carpinus fangiana]|uniref:RWD domain-containing protein n=1 Tax=Carpinus fangiana TaxID=176857 RepID=A0A5N6L168_9ROSI|nr:hypothetical protein FH972_025453 [Carpinus fangiana]